MKKIPLLPTYYRWIGLLISFLVLLLYGYQSVFELQGIFVHTFVLISDVPFDQVGILEMKEVDILLTVILVGWLVGLSFIAFAKTKVEDEMINSLRLYSWTWAILVMLILSVLACLFIYGKTYLAFALLFGHGLLFFFIVIFYANLRRMNKRGLADEE